MVTNTPQYLASLEDCGCLTAVDGWRPGSVARDSSEQTSLDQMRSITYTCTEHTCHLIHSCFGYLDNHAHQQSMSRQDCLGTGCWCCSAVNRPWRSIAGTGKCIYLTNPDTRRLTGSVCPKTLLESTYFAINRWRETRNGTRHSNSPVHVCGGRLR